MFKGTWDDTTIMSDCMEQNDFVTKEHYFLDTLNNPPINQLKLRVGMSLFLTHDGKLILSTALNLMNWTCLGLG